MGVGAVENLVHPGDERAVTASGENRAIAPLDDRLSNLVRAFASKAGTREAAAPEPAALPRLIVRQLDWSNGRLAFTDHLADREFKADLGPIRISVSDLSTLPDQSGQQRVSIATRSGGSIAWSGSLRLAPLPTTCCPPHRPSPLLSRSDPPSC